MEIKGKLLILKALDTINAATDHCECREEFESLCKLRNLLEEFRGLR